MRAYIISSLTPPNSLYLHETINFKRNNPIIIPLSVNNKVKRATLTLSR